LRFKHDCPALFIQCSLLRDIHQRGSDALTPVFVGDPQLRNTQTIAPIFGGRFNHGEQLVILNDPPGLHFIPPGLEQFVGAVRFFLVWRVKGPFDKRDLESRACVAYRHIIIMIGYIMKRQAVVFPPLAIKRSDILRPFIRHFANSLLNFSGRPEAITIAARYLLCKRCH
jgi:hypothetical protein